MIAITTSTTYLWTDGLIWAVDCFTPFLAPMNCHFIKDDTYYMELDMTTNLNFTWPWTHEEPHSSTNIDGKEFVNVARSLISAGTQYFRRALRAQNILRWFMRVLAQLCKTTRTAYKIHICFNWVRNITLQNSRNNFQNSPWNTRRITLTGLHSMLEWTNFMMSGIIS